MTKSLRQIVSSVLLEVSGPEAAVQLSDPLATALKEALHAEGYEIHNVRDGRCVRPRGDPPGRPMTTDEMKALGLTEGGAG